MMSQSQFLDLLKETIWMIVLLGGPMLIVAMVVGIGISLFQAVTQIQEATLTFVPKILAGLFTLIFISPWMLHVFIDHTQRIFDTMTKLPQ